MADTCIYPGAKYDTSLQFTKKKKRFKLFLKNVLVPVQGFILYGKKSVIRKRQSSKAKPCETRFPNLGNFKICRFKLPNFLKQHSWEIPGDKIHAS